MLLLRCAKYSSKKSRFIENQKAKGLLSNLGIITPLSKVPSLRLYFVIYFYCMFLLILYFVLDASLTIFI